MKYASEKRTFQTFKMHWLIHIKIIIYNLTFKIKIVTDTPTFKIKIVTDTPTFKRVKVSHICEH